MKCVTLDENGLGNGHPLDITMSHAGTASHQKECQSQAAMDMASSSWGEVDLVQHTEFLLLLQKPSTLGHLFP
jgi:hypothetical protein